MTASQERQGLESRPAGEQYDVVGARFGMWLFLFTEVLLFGGLFILYSSFGYIYRKQFLQGTHELNLVLGSLNTVVLLTSSLSVACAIAATKRGDRRLSMLLLLVTVLLALVFLVNKYFEWSHKIEHGIYPNSPTLLKMDKGLVIFYGLYFVMTGLHALHVIVGAVLLSIMTLYVGKGWVNTGRNVLLENSGLYWHIVDIVWIFLFPLFYLIR